MFELVFPRPRLGATLGAVAGHGVHHIQLDLLSAGLPSIPQGIPDDVAFLIRQECESRNITIEAVSSAYNMVHPDLHIRQEGLAALRDIAAACHAMGTSVIMLCTGTRNVESIWLPPPDVTVQSWG